MFMVNGVMPRYGWYQNVDKVENNYYKLVVNLFNLHDSVEIVNFSKIR